MEHSCNNFKSLSLTVRRLCSDNIAMAKNSVTVQSIIRNVRDFVENEAKSGLRIDLKRKSLRIEMILGLSKSTINKYLKDEPVSINM